MLAVNAESVFNAIRALNKDLDDPEITKRLGMAHAFYVLEETGRRPLFGFSKFVGYEGMTVKRYLNTIAPLDGGQTERHLLCWFREVRPGSAKYRRLHRNLAAVMEPYGKRPRKGVRFMVLRPEFQDDTVPNEDRRLLDLLLAVAELLPRNQRHELKAGL